METSGAQLTTKSLTVGTSVPSHREGMRERQQDELQAETPFTGLPNQYPRVTEQNKRWALCTPLWTAGAKHVAPEYLQNFLLA